MPSGNAAGRGGVEPGRSAGGPRPPLAPRWRWTLVGFLLLFVALAASTAYFAAQRVPLARCLDPRRSALVALPPPAAGVEARVMVLNLPADGQVRARYAPPERAGESPRVLIEWSAAHAGEPGGGHERLLSLELPYTESVDVIDLRGPVPERMPLTLPRTPAPSPPPSPAPDGAAGR